MAILKIRDENGDVHEIAALRGPQGLKGEDAYAKVVEYGYEGTEEEFYLAMSQNGKAPDKTLSVEGAYADAKAVGDAISASVKASDKTLTVDGAYADAKAVGQRLDGAAAALEEHADDTVIHITEDERNRWDGAATTFQNVFAVPAGYWDPSDDGHYFLQQVYAEWFRQSDVPSVGVASVCGDPDTTEVYERCLAEVFHIEPGDGHLELQARNAPNETFYILVKVVR